MHSAIPFFLVYDVSLYSSEQTGNIKVIDRNEKWWKTKNMVNKWDIPKQKDLAYDVE